jgi:hypothetical protein
MLELQTLIIHQEIIQRLIVLIKIAHLAEAHQVQVIVLLHLQEVVLVLVLLGVVDLLEGAEQKVATVDLKINFTYTIQ